MATVDTPMVDSASDQRRLAADAVAEVAEERRADRPRQKGDPNVASEASVAEAGSDAGKNKLGKDEHRRRRVNVEIEKLNGRADHAGKEDFTRRVDGPMGQGWCRAHGLSVSAVRYRSGDRPLDIRLWRWLCNLS